MKHLKTYEKYNNRRKVYWIVPFDSNKFEDSIVKLMMKYSELEEDHPYSRIEIINHSLGLANSAREDFNDEKFALILLEFEMENDKLIFGPKWNILPESSKKILDDYIFVGFFNTTKEEYDLAKNSEKYNL